MGSWKQMQHMRFKCILKSSSCRFLKKKRVCHANFKATLAHWLLTSPEWIFIYSGRNPCHITSKRWRALRNGSFVAAFQCENKTQIEWQETKHGSKPHILIQFSHFLDYHHKICLVFAIINHEETTHVLDMLFQAQARTVTGIFRVKRKKTTTMESPQSKQAAWSESNWRSMNEGW